MTACDARQAEPRPSGYTVAMLFMPSIPQVPAEQEATATMHLRYDDVCQDGRVALTAFPHVMGVVTWGKLLRQHAASAEPRKQGIFPILSRATIRGHDGVVSAASPVTGKGGFELGHTRNDSGEVERLILTLWVELTGEKGRTHGPQPADRGAAVSLGTMVAEHVFTRPFAPREQRKVRELALPGMPAVPEAVRTWRAPETTLELPAGARPLDAELYLDDAPVVFGLGHTDSNQHVNSLVYPRLFEEAALRRFARLGQNTRLLPRYMDIAYRKPCFAGEVMRIVLRAFALGEELGAAGYLVSDAEASTPDRLARARPACFLQMLFSRSP